MTPHSTIAQPIIGNAAPSPAGVVQLDEVPEVLRRASAMDRPDYVDLFTVEPRGVAAASPEKWTRTAVEDTAGLGGQFVWRVFCGLRLDSRPTADRIGGWQVAGRGDHWLRLEAASWFMTAHLVVLVEDARVSVATFIHYDRQAGALIWPALAVVHRALMPGLLRGTAGRMRRAS